MSDNIQSLADPPLLAIHCVKEAYALRLLKSNILFVLLLVAYFIGSLFLKPVLLPALVFLAILVSVASVGEARFSLIQLNALPADLYIVYYEGSQVKNVSLLWNEIKIISNQQHLNWPHTMFKPQDRPILRILKNDEVVFQLYAETNKELGPAELTELINNLKNIQQSLIHREQELR